MIAEDQSETINFLSDPTAYGRGDGEIQKIETHGAFVFLAGEYAYKLKRAVKFDYMDFSTVSKRREVCETEIKINTRTAPEIYLGVLAIVRTSTGDLELISPDTLSNDAAVIDWVVEMKRFDNDALLDQVAVRGDLTPNVVTALADKVVQFHELAEVRPEMGGRAAHWAIIDSNHTQFLQFSESANDIELATSIAGEAFKQLEYCGEEIERRRISGLVRHCHGDMHLGNIFLLDGVPTLFDAIEFNQKIACVDVLYDLAFLLMDLIERQLPEYANQVLNRYLIQTAIPDYGRLGGLKCLPLFLSCRAGVRAHVNATIAASHSDESLRKEYTRRASEYLNAAARYLVPGRSRAVAIGGLSGTGKSVLAGWMSPKLGVAPGALWIRSDVIRKRLFRKDPQEALGPEAYSSEVNEQVYSAMLEMSSEALSAGHSIVVDAVFAKESERLQIAETALSKGADFNGIWLQTSKAEMALRIKGRHGDASDATIDVLEKQLNYDLGTMEWSVVDASGSEKQTQDATQKLLNSWLNG